MKENTSYNKFFYSGWHKRRRNNTINYQILK